MIKPKLAAPLAVIAAAVAGAAPLVMTRPPLEPAGEEFTAPLVRVMEARPGLVDMVVESQGTVSPRTVADLVPEVSGEVVWTSSNLVAGGHFEPEETLLRIDSRDYRIAVDRARAAVDRAEAERESARFELQRLQEMRERQLISLAEMETGIRAARVADAALADAEAGLERAQLDLERTGVRAPFEGVVRTEQVDIGQFVSRGAPIASLYAVDYMEVRLLVADRQLAWLASPARAVLSAQTRRTNCPWVFASPCGGPAKVDAEWNAVRAVAELPKLRIHDLRHSHAAVTMKSGEGLRVVAGLLGHADIKTTFGYTHLAEGSVFDAANRVSRGLADMLNGGEADHD